MPRNRVTRGLSDIGSIEPPRRAAGLAIWESGRLVTCGVGSSGTTAGLARSPEWARVRRAGDGSRGRITMASFGTLRPCKLAKALMS